MYPTMGFTADGKALSQGQGQLGSKVEFDGHVISQHSIPIETPRGVVYSHIHLLEDDSGNLYKYKGSSYFPKGHHVRFIATVHAYARGDNPRDIITVLRAPKPIKL
jgi:hypothetical protein